MKVTIRYKCCERCKQPMSIDGVLVRELGQGTAHLSITDEMMSAEIGTDNYGVIYAPTYVEGMEMPLYSFAWTPDADQT